MSTASGQNFSAQKGMTLVELLVAIAISAVAIGAVLNMLTVSLKSLRNLKYQLEVTQQSRMAFERMTREISAAFRPVGLFPTITYRTGAGYLPWLIVQNTASTGADPVPASGVGEELSLIVSMYQGTEAASPVTSYGEYEPEPAVGDLTEVHYYLSGSATSASPRHLYRRQDVGVLGVSATASGTSDGPNLLSDKWDGTLSAEPLAFYVKDMDFHVYKTDGTNVDDYSNLGTSTEELPKRIRIKLTFYDPDFRASDMTLAADVSVRRD